MVGRLPSHARSSPRNVSNWCAFVREWACGQTKLEHAPEQAHAYHPLDERPVSERTSNRTIKVRDDQALPWTSTTIVAAGREPMQGYRSWRSRPPLWSPSETTMRGLRRATNRSRPVLEDSCPHGFRLGILARVDAVDQPHLGYAAQLVMQASELAIWAYRYLHVQRQSISHGHASAANQLEVGLRSFACCSFPVEQPCRDQTHGAHHPALSNAIAGNSSKPVPAGMPMDQSSPRAWPPSSPSLAPSARAWAGGSRDNPGHFARCDRCLQTWRHPLAVKLARLLCMRIESATRVPAITVTVD